jgi:hypothetical protein
MGKENIQRLKNKIDIPDDDTELDKHLDLIDRIYYENQVYCEEEDKKRDITSWKFQDGTVIEMDFEDMCRYLQIIEILEGSEEMFI